MREECNHGQQYIYENSNLERGQAMRWRVRFSTPELSKKKANSKPKQYISHSCKLPLIIMDSEMSIEAILHKDLSVIVG